jgi:hypothetical protein
VGMRGYSGIAMIFARDYADVLRSGVV